MFQAQQHTRAVHALSAKPNATCAVEMVHSVSVVTAQSSCISTATPCQHNHINIPCFKSNIALLISQNYTCFQGVLRHITCCVCVGGWAAVWGDSGGSRRQGTCLECRRALLLHQAGWQTQGLLLLCEFGHMHAAVLVWHRGDLVDCYSFIAHFEQSKYV